MASKSTNLAKKGAAAKTSAVAELEATLDGVAESLKKGDEVRLVGFGTFSVRERAAGKGRNPATAKEIKIWASKGAFRGPSHAKTQKLRFGSVTIEGGAPSSATVKHNISLGQSALERGFKALVKPGVKLSRGKGIPIYRADPNDPRILIRELNGRDERGALVDGEFKIVK